MYLAETS